MKNLLFQHLPAAILCLLGALVTPSLHAQTVIGASAPNPSAMLDVQSTSKGFLPPRMTSTERSAIQNPATGLIIFNTTLNCVEMNMGAPAQPTWSCLAVLNTVSAASATPSVDVNTALTAITHTTTGATGIGTATGLPAGVTASWAANTITISGTPTAVGTFNYSIPLTGGIGSVSAMGTITVNPAGCGAVVDVGGVWKVFKCHNLGADTLADPFMASWRLIGNYYQWGRNTNITSGSPRYGAEGPTGSDSGEANSGSISDWNTTAAPGAWVDSIKTATDPCPAGFRVPTRAQWQAVINSSLNPTVSYGTGWGGSPGSPTNYAAGLRIGSGTSGLFLPAAGYRNGSDGALNGRGSFGDYWSSTENGSSAWGLGFTSGPVGMGIYARTNGMSVRCVAE